MESQVRGYFMEWKRFTYLCIHLLLVTAFFLRALSSY